MPACRCRLCGLNWPIDDKFDTCPKCGEETTRYGNVKAMPQDEVSEELFAAYYAKWDESHPAARLSTDGLPDYVPTPPAVS